MTGVLIRVVTVIGVGTELVTGVGVDTLCIVFLFFCGGYPRCPSSFLN